jgi:hypothetical protein
MPRADEVNLVCPQALATLELWGTKQLRLPQEDRTGGAGVIDHYLSYFSEVLSARPITLKFSRQAK